MSYQTITPEFYQMFTPGTPWHAGAEGWSVAPVPGWGDNPNLVGPPRLAMEGLGAYYRNELVRPIDGLGAYYRNQLNRPIEGLGCSCESVGAFENIPGWLSGSMLFIGGMIAGVGLVYLQNKDR